MTRASWKGALFAAVASTGVAWGQWTALPTDAARPAERIVTIRQSGGLPEACRVLRTWTTERGQKAWLLQSLDAEEILTVVQPGGDKAGATDVKAQIYRWSNSIMPPEVSPVPPDEAIRPASHVTPAPEPRLTPAAATVMTSPPPVVGHAPAACEKDNGHCGYVHHYEKPASISFKAGECLPVCAPVCSPSYGYYPTQWRAWPGGIEGTRPISRE